MREINLKLGSMLPFFLGSSQFRQLRCYVLSLQGPGRGVTVTVLTNNVVKANFVKAGIWQVILSSLWISDTERTGPYYELFTMIIASACLGLLALCATLDTSCTISSLIFFLPLYQTQHKGALHNPRH